MDLNSNVGASTYSPTYFVNTQNHMLIESLSINMRFKTLKSKPSYALPGNTARLVGQLDPAGQLAHLWAPHGTPSVSYYASSVEASRPDATFSLEKSKSPFGVPIGWPASQLDTAS